MERKLLLFSDQDHHSKIRLITVTNPMSKSAANKNAHFAYLGTSASNRLKTFGSTRKNVAPKDRLKLYLQVISIGESCGAQPPFT